MMSGNTDGVDAIKTVEVDVDGTQAASFDFDVSADCGVPCDIPSTMGWTEKVYEFTATDSAMDLTFTSLEADAAREYGHLTARQVAELAVAAGVETLILYHLSRRYSEREILEEARPIFANTVVARDLDHFQIRRDVPLAQVGRDT